MNRLRLSLLLNRQNRKAMKRHPALDQGLVARVLMLIGSGFMMCYLIFLGTMMAIPASETHMPGMLLAMMPLWMLIDFGVRFVVQQTPDVMVKPYLLQPVPFASLIDTFLATSLTTGYNFIWLAMLLPYAFVVYCGGVALSTSIAIILTGMLIVLMNSQFYLIVRTLVARSILWWLLPVVAYASFFLTLFIDEDLFDDQMDIICEMTTQWWTPLACLALLAAIIAVNRQLQMHYVRKEVVRTDTATTQVKHVSQFSFLNSFGQTGEYMKLELKSIMRNKSIRSRVFTSLALIVILTLLISYTDIYDNRLFLAFWCFYCFGLYGMTTLVKIMGAEGNYIDQLLMHRENILSLLTAKYYIHVAILLVPFVLMLPAVFAGKFSWLMMVAYFLLTSGFLYFTLFQLAVYNKQTLPLNAKLTGKGNMENGIQIIVEMVAILVPQTLVVVFVLLLQEETAYIVLAVTGLLLTLSHPLWLRNIYKRMMKRKYVNLDGFHCTRQ